MVSFKRAVQPAPLNNSMRSVLRSWRSIRLVTHAGRWGLTCLFALTTLGLPLDDWLTAASPDTPTACALNPGSVCQCPPARKRAGRCCCQLKPKAVASIAGCCAKRAKSEETASSNLAKSCATNRPEPISAGKNDGLSITSCGCGEGEALGLLWSGEPRLLVRPLPQFVLTKTFDEFSAENARAIGARPQPDVPPPRDRHLSV